jgi:hypothetical protein
MNGGKPISIVDGEKNIRLTLSTSSKTLGVNTDSPEVGKEALDAITRYVGRNGLPPVIENLLPIYYTATQA